MAAGVHAVQRGGLGGTGVVWQQIVGVAVHKMVGVPLHHKALGTGQAELRHQRVEVGGIIIGIGQQQHLATAAQIAAQQTHFVHKAARRGKILRGVVDDEQVAVLRDAAGEQIQRREGKVLAFQRIGQGVGQGLLAVVGGVVGVLLLPAGQAVDGRGDLVFACKGHAVGSGGVVVGVVVIVEVGCVQHNILVPGNEDHTAGRGLLCAVLGRKGRVDCRVLQLPRNVAAFGSVFIQQLGDDLIFIAGLAEVVDGHILRKLPCHLLGAVAEGIEPGLREVEFGVLGRDGPHQQIQQHHRCDHRCCNGSRIQAAAEHFSVRRGFFRFQKFHRSAPPFSSSGASRCSVP